MRDLVDAIRPLLNSVMSDIGVQESDWNNLLASSTDSAFADVAMPCHSESAPALNKFRRGRILISLFDVLGKGSSASLLKPMGSIRTSPMPS